MTHDDTIAAIEAARQTLLGKGHQIALTSIEIQADSDGARYRVWAHTMKRTPIGAQSVWSEAVYAVRSLPAAIDKLHALVATAPDVPDPAALAREFDFALIADRYNGDAA